VFGAVGGKAMLLKLALDWALVGDDEPVPMVDRPEVRAEMAQTDPARLVHLWARRLSAIEARVARLALVMAAAADADPEVARLHAHSEDGRRGGARAFVTRLDVIGGLRADLDLDRATAIAGVVSEPLLYMRLVVEAGWSVEEYAGWMERTAVAALLPT
jgi:hypothetical protein